jgi:N-acetylneuraminic acid mutarotase
MRSLDVIRGAAAALALLSLAACGVVNGLGGPWPPGGGTDGGPVVVPSDGGTCPAGTHNGGDGSCVADGECLTGYTYEAAGRCSRWSTVAALTPARSLLSVIGLADGKALAVGGLAGNVPVGEGPAHVYEPDTDTWQQTDGSVRARYGHTATLLGGNRVVIAGGLGEGGEAVMTAELYRGDQDRWVDLGDLVYGREGHVAVSAGGAFLVVGGRGANGAVLATVEQLDGGDFTVISASMSTARADFAAAAIGDNVYVFGGLSGNGEPLSSVERLKVGEGSFVGRAAMVDARAEATATVLNDGRIVVIGGLTDGGDMLEPLRTIEVYDPDDDRWEDLAPLTIPRWGHEAILREDGRVMIIGGFTVGDTATDSVEILDPELGSVSEGPTLSAARGHAPSALIRNGEVLVVQGSLTVTDEAAVVSVERYTFGADDGE